MALSRMYTIKCDSCGDKYLYHFNSPKAARSSAKHNGWMRIVVGMNAFGMMRRDYCPKCIEKYRACRCCGERRCGMIPDRIATTIRELLVHCKFAVTLRADFWAEDCLEQVAEIEGGSAWLEQQQPAGAGR